MPWRERSAMDEKASFILEWESGEHTFKALCKSYGVSRALGYRLVRAICYGVLQDFGSSRELRVGCGTAPRLRWSRPSWACGANGSASVR